MNECLNVCIYNEMPSTHTRAFFRGKGKEDRRTVLDSEIDVPLNEVFCQVYTEKQDLHLNIIFKVIHLLMSLPF